VLGGEALRTCERAPSLSTLADAGSSSGASRMSLRRSASFSAKLASTCAATARIVACSSLQTVERFREISGRGVAIIRVALERLEQHRVDAHR
jgi:hypothetical protein